MKKVLIYLMRFGLQMIYAVLKLLPTKKNKVVFLSRQSDTLTPDFEMVQQELRREDPQIEIVTICHRLEGAGSGGIECMYSRGTAAFWNKLKKEVILCLQIRQAVAGKES